MSSDPKTPGERREAPEAAPEKPEPPKPGANPYGGVWAGGTPRVDTSGQGSAPRPPGAPPAATPEPAAPQSAGPAPEKPQKDVYGGVWGGETPREDTSGRGSAPRPPGAPETPEPPKSSERKSFSGSKPEGGEKEGEGPEIAADDAGASGRTETRQRRPD